MEIKEIRISYEEWIKNPFPQNHALQLDVTTRYVVTNCPPEYAEHLKKIGIKFDLKTK